MDALKRRRLVHGKANAQAAHRELSTLVSIFRESSAAEIVAAGLDGGATKGEDLDETLRETLAELERVNGGGAPPVVNEAMER